MLVLELTRFGHIDVAHRDEPELGASDALVEIIATGICGSDIHGFTGENGRRVPGQVMGHETVGRVVVTGTDVQRALAPGQLVTINPLISCQDCAACTANSPQHCAGRRVIGVAPDIVSAFAERIAVPAANVVPLAPHTPPELGALVEPLAVAFHAVRRARVRQGQTVVVIGGGPIGQSVLLAALHAGARSVLVSEMDPARRALCGELGAVPLDPATAPVADQVRGILGSPADVAIDAVGVDASLDAAINSVKLGGVVTLVGMGAPSLRLDSFRLSTEERELIGSFCYTPDDFTDAAAYVDRGVAPLRRLISREVPPERADEAFTGLAAGDGTAGKVLIRFKADS